MAPVSRPQEIVIFRGRDVTITGDARAFPLVIVDTDGEVDVPTFDPYLDWRNQWIEYAAHQGVKIVQISITTNAKPPSATVRKHIADRCKDDDKLPGFAATHMVVPSALMRGVVTAVTWMMGSSSFLKNFGSVVDATEAAKRTFAEAGITAPSFNAKDYTLPTEA